MNVKIHLYLNSRIKSVNTKAVYKINVPYLYVNIMKIGTYIYINLICPFNVLKIVCSIFYSIVGMLIFLHTNRRYYNILDIIYLLII